MEKFKDNVEKLNSDPEFIEVISPEKDAEMVYNTLKNEARAKGLKEGKEEGLKEGRIETAKNFLKENIAIETISKCTGLSIEEIKNL